MTTEADRVLTLLQRVTSALCVDCLAKVTSVPLSTMRVTTTRLREEGSVILAPEHPCQVCGKPPALRAKGGL